jgi:hypothetical protein
MMRPTASSASKALDKAEPKSPPRKLAAVKPKRKSEGEAGGSVQGVESGEDAKAEEVAEPSNTGDVAGPSTAEEPDVENPADTAATGSSKDVVKPKGVSKQHTAESDEVTAKEPESGPDLEPTEEPTEEPVDEKIVATGVPELSSDPIDEPPVATKSEEPHLESIHEGHVPVISAESTQNPEAKDTIAADSTDHPSEPLNEDAANVEPVEVAAS